MRITIYLAVSFLCIIACSGFLIGSYGEYSMKNKGSLEDRAFRYKMMNKQVEIEMKTYRNIFKNINSWMRKRF